jgi:hypothetical protein
MRFRTHIDPIRQRVLVYCEVGRAENGSRLFVSRHEHPNEVVEVRPGGEPPIWDRFPMEIADELAEALNPRPPVTERHLDDAIAVRDRLLTLVERTSS